jgi:hypothetical protein
MLKLYREIEINIDLFDLLEELSDEKIEEIIEYLVDRELVVKVEEDLTKD